MRLNIIALIAIFSIVYFPSNAVAQNASNTFIQSYQPLNNSMVKISSLTPVSFQYNKSDAGKLKLPTGLQYGFNPDELQKVFPEMVKTNHKMVPSGKNTFKTVAMKEVDLENLIPLLVGSIKEQQEEILKLKAEMEALRRLVKK